MNHVMNRIMFAGATAVAWTYVLLSPALALAAPHAQDGHAAAGEAHHEAASGIVWVSDIFGNTGKTGLLFILFNFAVLMYLLEKILFSKLRAKTRDKHETVKAELSHATEAHREAKSMVADYRAKLDGLAKQGEALLEEARERAESDRKRIIEAAEREAQQIRTSATAAAERDADAHRRRLEGEVIDRAVERAEAIIRERIGANDQRTMVDDYVSRLTSVDLSGHAKRTRGAAS
ncbi:MAG: ATP synthase F0 subunit B [Nannocystaceae bacterium]|nr:ATP synthase F0 subunit B [Nannocystaceae bacterium]